MDDSTMRLGLFMEAAQANQKAAEASLKRLKAVSGELASIVRSEVHSVLLEELHALAQDTKRASDALHGLRNAATLRIGAWSMAITALCSAIPLGLACWLVPSRAEIATLRARRDELSARVAQLERAGGRIDLRRCGDGARLCVRVDRRAPTYGEQADYLVVRGY